MKPKSLTGFFKRGSTWAIAIIRKDSAGVAVSLAGMTARSIFRTESVDGTIILTLNSENGLTIPTPANGTMQISLSPVQTVLFPVGVDVYFDVELTTTATDEVWQSPTYKIKSEQEVTRGV